MAEAGSVSASTFDKVIASYEQALADAREAVATVNSEGEYNRDRLALISATLKWWSTLPADSGQNDGDELAYLVSKAMNEPGWHGGYGHYGDCEPDCRGDSPVEAGGW